jgi:hypothetical protein
MFLPGKGLASLRNMTDITYIYIYIYIYIFPNLYIPIPTGRYEGCWLSERQRVQQVTEADWLTPVHVTVNAQKPSKTRSHSSVEITCASA